MKKSYLIIFWNFTKNLSDLYFIILIMLMMIKWSFHEIVLQKQRFSMSLKEYHDKIIKEHKE